MDGAMSILVVILSVFLAIFLLLSIALIIILIRLSRQIRSVTESAQKTAEGIERTVSGLSAFATPVAIAKIVKNVINISKTKKKETK